MPKFGIRPSKHYLENLIGNSLNTMMGAASLIFSRVLGRHSKLKIDLFTEKDIYLTVSVGWIMDSVSGRSAKPTPEILPHTT